MENDLLNPVVISYCNKYKSENFENTRRFVETLENNKWQYHILGEGEIWKGFAYRMATYKNFLNTLHPNKIVVVSDAHDVYCLKNPDCLISEFKNFNKGMIVGLELFAENSLVYDKNKDYFQVTWLGPYFKHNNIDYNQLLKPFVNAGLIIGYAKDIINFYEWSLNNDYKDDQLALGAYMNAFPDKVYADLNSDMLHTTTAFINCGIQSRKQFYDSPCLNQFIGQSSYFIHIPNIKGSKGQEFLYNVIYEILQLLNFNIIQNIYPYYELSKFKNYYTYVDNSIDQYQ